MTKFNSINILKTALLGPPDNTIFIVTETMPAEEVDTPAGYVSTFISTTTIPTPVITVQIKDDTIPKTNGKSPATESTLSIRDGEKDTNIFSEKIWRLIEIWVAEVIGTGCLMFFGCMGLIGENIPPLQGALGFGLVICTIIQIFGHISAAHLNPVVTVTAVVLGKIDFITAIVYFVAEFVGATLGFKLLEIVTPDDLWNISSGGGRGVCATIPLSGLNDFQSLTFEFLATFFLILVVCSIWDARNADKPDSVPLKFAAVITVISTIVGPFTGASMNPARTFAPSLINKNWTKHWVFGVISGAHLNPAVTIAAVILGSLSPVMGLVYLICQFTGSTLGIFVLKLAMSNKIWDERTEIINEVNAGVCVTDFTKVGAGEAVALEFFATSFLVFIVCSAHDYRTEYNRDSFSLKVAAVIAADVIAIGEFTGASLNTARTFGPAVINNYWVNHWVYWVGPNLAGIVTPIVYRLIWMPKPREDAVDAGALNAVMAAMKKPPSGDGSSPDEY